MNTRAMRKDFWMEIRKSPGRFLSIFFIVALGTSFFSGIRSAQPDMLITGDSYFDGARLMDVKAVSTLGITEDDIAAVEALDGVQAAEGGYSVDVMCRQDDVREVLHVMSFLPSMNAVELTEGRLPEEDWECVVDDETEYRIGDMLYFLWERKYGDRDREHRGLCRGTAGSVSHGSIHGNVCCGKGREGAAGKQRPV